MPHIDIDQNIPGIRSLVLYRPDTGRVLYQLVQTLLRGPSPLSEADRELLAARVSFGNECRFCCNSHATAARYLYGDQAWIVDAVLNNNDDLKRVDPLLRTLLIVAGEVQQSGSSVTAAAIENARAAGATDRHIHDTVLIAATFSLFNRYVDGLAAFTPSDQEIYREMGLRMAQNGYVYPGISSGGSGKSDSTKTKQAV